jgi:HEAT repeat protein
LTLEQCVNNLTDREHPLRQADLLSLSGMTSEEVDFLRCGWPDIDATRRREVLDLLIEITEDNLEADFNDIFRFCLTDESPEVRARALEGLWECDDRILVTPLVTLLREDPSDNVRAAAAMTLGKFVVLAQSGMLLYKDAGKISGALLQTIRDSEECRDVRRRAIEAIAPFDTTEVHQIIKEAYNSDQIEMTYSAVYAMGRSCDSRWLPIILQELRNTDPAMRYEAANACGEMEEEDAVPHLIPLFQDEDLQAQTSAISAVGNIGGSLSKRALLSCLKSSDDLIIEAAQEALSKLDGSEMP